MKLEIEPSQFFEMVKNQYSLDYVYLLKLLKEEVDVKEWCESSERFATLHTSLLRRGLINEEDKLTLVGKELVTFAESEGEKVLVKKKVDDKDFERWWEIFPKKDTFDYKGKHFVGSRTFRVKEKDCKIKFNTIVREGKYTANQIINATKCDVKSKMENSFRTGQNKLQFLQNSLTYLNQRTFINFIDDEVPEEEEDDGVYNGTDI